MKMETREELLNGLNDAVNILRQLVNDQHQLKKVRGQYRKIQPNLNWKNMRIAYIVFIVVFLFYIYPSIAELFEFDSFFMPYITIILVVYLGIKSYCKIKNKKIDKENEQIRTTNETTKVQEQQIVNEIEQIQQAYHDRVSWWYPSDYCSVDAAEFFYNVIKNYRADNIKEAINLYEVTLHQRRIESNQKQAIAQMEKQQKLNNLLAIGSIALQGAALGEMSRHNARQEFAAREANNTLSDIRSHLH